uniref:Uncharacterized protein n=1 Tax=Glossina austeni TaxID=7395 RepID=A0A1A9UDI4_GLOAU
MYTSFLSTWKLLSFNKAYCCVIPFNGFVVKRFKATALNLVENVEESISKAAVTTTLTTKCATTLSCVQAHHHQQKPQEHAVELVDKCPNIEFPVTGQLIQKKIALERKRMHGFYGNADGGPFRTVAKLIWYFTKSRNPYCKLNGTVY